MRYHLELMACLFLIAATVEEAVRLNPDDRAAQDNLKMAYEKIKD